MIGETGTGCGVGLAWLASAAHPGAQIVSIERNPERAAAVARLFHDDPRVRVCQGDWSELLGHGPFDLLVLDGGGQGKRGEPPLDPLAWMRPGGLIVIDDFTPSIGWPRRSLRPLSDSRRRSTDRTRAGFAIRRSYPTN